MRTYGANKSTEFTKKQISVIYGMAKRQELKVEKWVIYNFYDLAEFYGYDDNRSVEDAESEILDILDSVFGKDIDKAQNQIDKYAEKHFVLLSRKSQQKCDRNYL